jgi:serine/threonine protein kinase
MTRPQLIMIGRKLSHFEITAQLGEGGMGEVYRAQDTRLGREVAIKILPEAVAQDPERLARFEREAKVLASLNHPHIAAIYSLESAQPTAQVPEAPGPPLRFLVMELAEGETLAERLADGPIPIDQVIPIARQTAEALEAAHEKGIIHRDLKPANVKVTPEGEVKVLDFGLAKALESDTPGSSSPQAVSASPTLTARMTQAGVLLGTAAYMSPEQARAQEAGKQADIWAFGCVVFEMLTGRRAFEGETVSDTLAAILTRDPDWEALPSGSPEPLRHLLERCLAKETKERYRDIGDVALQLADLAGKREKSPPAPSPVKGARRLSWILAAALSGLLIGALLTSLVKTDWETRPLPVRRLSISASNGSTNSTFEISPDGETIVYAEESEGQTRLLQRRLDQFDSSPIAGTEGGFNPFFSPDGQWVGFLTRDSLKKVPLEGGPARTIADIGDLVHLDPTAAFMTATATWSPLDTIVFSSGNWRSSFDVPGLYQVPASGGTPEALTKNNPARYEAGHLFPRFLPDGSAVAFTTARGTGLGYHLELVSLETGSRKELVDNAGGKTYLVEGNLVFADSFFGRLVAAPFDSTTQEITGRRVPLVEALRTDVADSYSISDNGTLVYIPTGTAAGEFEVVEVDRQGKVSPLIERPGAWVQPRLSPDGKRLVLRELGDQCMLWLYDLERRSMTRLTFEDDSHNPVWSPDGRHVAFGYSSGTDRALYMKRADGSQPAERLASGDGAQLPSDWSEDGRFIVFTEEHQTTGLDLWILPMEGAREAQPFLATRFMEHSASFSPNGDWLAYTSDETGREEVYVQPLPGPGAKIQVSTNGGSSPIWSRDGREMFYAAGNRMMAVGVTTQPQFRAEQPIELFRGNLGWQRAQNFTVSADSQRFIIPKPTGATSGLDLRVILNWFEEIRSISAE